MDSGKMIGKLNEAIALELGALLQYNQYSQVLLGPERRIWADWLKDTADEALGHARRFASRVVALGGTPAVEPDPIRQATDLHEMLANSLEVERRAVKIYTEALALCEDNPAYRNILEEQIAEETMDVEELEKYLNQVHKAGGVQPRARSKTA